ncbi:MAG: PAS domain S-box protein [Anaerolineae bacterium]|nr:PAS domain S-box protein [Anaerolineae bacterium]
MPYRVVVFAAVAALGAAWSIHPPAGGILLALLVGALIGRLARRPVWSLMEQAPDGIFVLDPQGRFVAANLQACELLGYTRAEFLNLHLRDVTPPDERDKVDACLPALEGGECNVSCKDGAVVPVEIGARRLADGCTVAIARDITGRRALEAASQRYARCLETLREIDRAILSAGSPEEIAGEVLCRLKDLISSTHANVVLFDFPADEMIMLAGYGYSERGVDAAAGTHHPLSLFRAAVLFLQMGKYRTVEDLSTKPNRFEFEDIMLAVGILSYLAVPLIAQGKLIGALDLGRTTPGPFDQESIAIAREVSSLLAIAIQQARLHEQVQRDTRELEMRVAERTAELNRTKEHTVAILNNSSDAILLTRADGFIEQTNPAFNTLFGYEADAVFGHNLAEYVAPESVETLAAALQALVEAKEPQRVEVTALHHDGAPFAGDLSLAPLPQYGEVLYVVMSLRDISALKQVERQLKRVNRLKTEFLSTAAHELRTPLTSIRGFSELLLERDLPEDRRRRYLKYIHEQATHLSVIIEDLLNISRLEAGRGLRISSEPFDMGALIQKVVLPFKESASKHCLIVEGDVDLPPVMGDPMRLTQVVQNLVSNAIKYSPGGGTVLIRVEAQGDALTVMVRDEGIGMTPEQQVHLFEKFYRADGSDTAIGGTGLGLAICKLIVETHGGVIWAESEYGVGSAFYFTIPLDYEAAPESA